MVFAHPQFIYPFGDTPFESSVFGREVVTDRNVSLAVHEASDDVAVIYFMGNGGALAYFQQSLAAHAVAGRTVVAMEYRGGAVFRAHPLRSD